jgi:hypothetical protein
MEFLVQIVDQYHYHSLHQQYQGLDLGTKHRHPFLLMHHLHQSKLLAWKKKTSTKGSCNLFQIKTTYKIEPMP